MAAPRQRLIDPATPTSNFYSNPQLPRIDSKSSGLLALTEKFWLIAIASCLALFVVVDINYHSFPQAQQPKVTLTVSERKSFEWEFKANTFLESNARVFLEKLCSFGTRHLGSKANEESAVTYITDVVKEIKTHANPLHEIELDIQAPSGCFDINFIGNFTTCYMNIKNILVRLSPVNQKSSSALLVNCHYDTAISSPGASDDAISCAIMMESLRLLSQSDQPLTHSIVFNFNGAEEAILQASHGFITQHPWAGQLKAFVNLEAAGSGGREIVFQTGPEHPWLVAAYAESAKYPYASIVAQEIFQSGVIPSDTDFRIYRDYGNIPGIDIAYVYNGYIYHTKYDQPKYIPPGCIQRGGENVLGIITNLANSEKLSDPGDSRLGKMVFFDVLGFFMIHYPLRLGEIINCATILAALLNLYRKIRLFKREGRNPTLYIKLVVASYMMHAAGFVAMVTVNIVIALSVSLVQPMMWYTNNWLVVPVYMLPAVAVWILVHQRGRHVGGANIFQLVSTWELESIFFEAALIFWTVLLALLTAYGVGSAYVCMLFIVCPLIIRQISLDLFNIKLHSSPKLYISLTALSLLVPFVHLMQFAHMLNLFFMPLMGRVGSEVNVDVVISLTTLLPVFIISTYLAGFLHVSKDMARLAIKLFVIALIFSLIGCFSSLGFPYSGNLSSPSAQRHVLHNFKRDFYSHDGKLNYSDHGLAYLPFDRNSKSHIEYIPEIEALQNYELDDSLAYGGIPYFFPLVSILPKVYIGPMEKPDISESIEVTHSKELIGDNTIRYNFLISAQSSHLNMYMAAAKSANISSWAFTPGTPIPTAVPSHFSRRHYFVFTTSATSPHPDKKFWVDVQVPPGADRSGHWLDFAVGAHYLDGDDSVTPQLEALLAKFPDWTVPIGWSASYQHHQL